MFSDRIINAAMELKEALKKVETWHDELIKFIETDLGDKRGRIIYDKRNAFVVDFNVGEVDFEGTIEAFSIQDILTGLKRNTDRVLEYYGARQ